ncbi:GrpE-domain-containing protein [Lentinus brumalis]|uniref:GrpE protein homolog n=1 Tax=Lentinus brumalis TaxID=2498619 RepID=A0A371DVK8_9APHY|nr:GrpE-domain-containing protein [Polyporus brumalis]
MFNTQAAQAFRSCTGALSSRTLARTSVNVAGRRAALAMRSRHYSDKAQSSDESKKPEENSEEQEKDEVEVSPETTLLHKLKAEETKVADCMSRLRYLQADFLNLQRNAAREKEQARDFAISRFAGDLLETVDVLSLALKSVPKSALTPPSESSDATAEKTPATHLRELYEGVEATHRLLLHTLFKHHVKPFDPTGEAFDPNKHEALYQAPIPGKEPGTVLECQKVGYTIKDRVLRAAQVGVVQDTSS